MGTDKEDGSTMLKEQVSSLSLATHVSWQDVPRTSIVSVEHPFIVENVAKGIEALGGPKALREVG